MLVVLFWCALICMYGLDSERTSPGIALWYQHGENGAGRGIRVSTGVVLTFLFFILAYLD